MHFFDYKDNSLFCENVALKKLAEQFSTPLYVYSKKTLMRHLNVLQEAFSEISPLLCFSMKANSSLAMCNILVKNGAGLDIVSGGELYKALKIGTDPQKIVYAGVGKTEEEIEFALTKSILLFNVESISELKLINKVAGKVGIKQKVSIRINPDVDINTHDYITTGKKITKFGVDFDTCRNIINSRAEYSNLNIAGFHIHIGSQITESYPFVESITKTVNFIEELKKDKFEIEYLNIGGGLGIVYKDENPQSAEQFAEAIIDLIRPLNIKIIMEPGRFIAGNSGILLTTVLYLKNTSVKNFVVIDAGMNDLLRPSLYNAYHEILPIKKNDNVGNVKVDIVGPICESGDFLAKDRTIQKVNAGDIMAIMGAGAYGFSMASNYNSRCLPAEVMVDNDTYFLVRKRQNYSDLIANENIPKELI